MEVIMSNIDNQLKYYLAKQGWYLGETHTDDVEKEVRALGVTDPFSFSSSGEMAWTDGGTIHINSATDFMASTPQLVLLALHEHYHIVRGDNGYKSKDKAANHAMELECDARALRHMIKSGMYTRKALMEAIRVFGDVINDPETPTHPSSRVRFNRLLTILKENVL